MTDKEIKEKIMDGDIEKVPEKTVMGYFEKRSLVQGMPTNAIKWLIRHGMIDKVPEEDLKMMVENIEAREHLSKDGASNLYKMICLQAVEDYKEVRYEMTFIHTSKTVMENIKKRKEALEKFFGSEFFLSNSGCPSKEYVIKMIERQIKARAQSAMVH